MCEAQRKVFEALAFPMVAVLGSKHKDTKKWVHRWRGELI